MTAAFDSEQLVHLDGGAESRAGAWRGGGFVPGVVMTLFGAYALASGLWVIGDGGAWSGALLGVGLVGGGARLARGRPFGPLVHGALWLGTLLWGLI